MNPFELARRLIEIESVTGNEKDVALFLRDHLRELKYEVSLQEAAPGRFNVLASAGRPGLVFSTHMDTVPPHIPFHEDDDYIYGRGACDAKGIIAGQVEAAERLRSEGENRIGLLFVSGEERNSVGALHANRHPIGSRFLIGGEPTENRLVAGSKGSLRAEIIAHGKAAHSARPESGDSAILKVLDVLQEVRRLKFERDPLLGETTCNIGIIEGGTKANIVPDRARAEIMFRAAEPLDRIKARLAEIDLPGVEINHLFEVPPAVMNVEEGFDTAVISFTSDVPLLDNWGKPYLMGPGSILDAHTDHERISKKRLLEGIGLYVRLAKRLLEKE